MTAMKAEYMREYRAKKRAEAQIRELVDRGFLVRVGKSGSVFRIPTSQKPVIKTMKKLVPVYPWPMHPKIAEVLEAIPGINLVEARAGGPAPVLAIRKAPPFPTDAVVVDAPEALAQAVSVVIGDGLHISTVRDVVAEAMNATLNHETIVPSGRGVKFQ